MHINKIIAAIINRSIVLKHKPSVKNAYSDLGITLENKTDQLEDV